MYDIDHHHRICIHPSLPIVETDWFSTMSKTSQMFSLPGEQDHEEDHEKNHATNASHGAAHAKKHDGMVGSVGTN